MTGLSGLSAAHIHKLRSGEDQDVTVDPRHSVLEFSQYSGLSAIPF